MARFSLEPMPNVAVADLVTVLEGEPVKREIIDGDILFAACQLVANAQGLTLKKPDDYEGLSFLQQLTQIANISHFRFRQVKLQQKWWKQDAGPLLVINKNDQPCALLPHKEGYELVLPGQDSPRLMTAELAADLKEDAYFFYQRFPEKSLRTKDLLKFIFKYLKKDITRAISYQVAISALGLFVPVITGVLFDQVIPTADIGMFWQIIAALIINVVVMSAFDIGQFVSILRIRLKSNVSVQAAIWDRVLRLPISFFKGYTSGDLAFRASGIDQIQQRLASITIQAIVNGLFSVLSFFLMFYYSGSLALWALLMLIIMIVVNIVASLMQLGYQRLFYGYQALVLSFLFQLLTNISKLRVANRETKIFSLWSDMFSKRTSWFMKARLVVAKLTVFQGIYAIFIIIVLYILVIRQGQDLSFGNFIIFNASFTQFFAAVSAMALAFANALQLIPFLQRAKVILEAKPEIETNKILLDHFKGKISLQSVSFRYAGENRLILNDLSLEINPGEFVAIVGPSGAGKSTVFRLLLGFEQPASGAIFFDDLNSKVLSFSALRQQYGVVLQNSNVIAASIFENIAANTYCSREDVWQVLQSVALADEVAAMPMQLDTIITEFGKTISVGQRQRLMLARALIRKPKLLLLDEATSALDNTNQLLIMQSLSQLKITRIIIAQRLNTIRNADCIYVLDRGKVVQTGTYQKLITQPGLFAQLTRQ